MADPTTDPGQRLLAAEARAERARQQLNRTVSRLQVKLNPRTLALSAARDVQDAGNAVARVGADTARQNPAAVAGAGALVLLFLIRRPVARLFSRKPKVKAQSKARPAGPPVT